MAFDRITIATTVAIVTIAMVFTSDEGRLMTSVGAFNSHIPRIESDLNSLQKNSGDRSTPSASNSPGPAATTFIGTRSNSNTFYNRDGVVLSSWLRDTFQALGLDFIQEKMKFQQPIGNNDDDDEGKPKSKHGTVIRTAVKGYHKEASLPSSNLYTTKKEARGQILVRPEGVKDDYNHYRTTALDSTPDRAVSILTTDILKMLKGAGWERVNEGDLGENIYIDGIDYTFFEVGRRYQFKTKGSDDEKSADKEEGVIVEITERIEPCGNLCKLTYINNESLEPRLRFEECKKFLLWLDEKEGLRGWYAKIIGDGGLVKLGDQVSALAVAQ